MGASDSCEVIRKRRNETVVSPLNHQLCVAMHLYRARMKTGMSRQFEGCLLMI